MIIRLYSLLIFLAQPILLLRLFLRGFKNPLYWQRIKERFACYNRLSSFQKGGIIAHAASVGEVMALLPLIHLLQQYFPHLPITVTTITPTGSQCVNRFLGESVQHVYLPYDTKWNMIRFLEIFQPSLCFTIETELWPNFIEQAFQRHIPFMVINARLSERSFQRYSKIQRFFQPLLQKIQWIATQDQFSYQRYLALGATERNLCNVGNIKFDLHIQPEVEKKLKQLREQFPKRPVWIAASTHEGEEEIILQVHQKLLENTPHLLLILVPRHPERFNSVAQLIEKKGLCFTRRSQQLPNQATQVWLGDSIGELMIMYGLAHVAFVGGSLVPHGGHNPLEPLLFKLPVISGLYTFNFTEIFTLLRNVKGVLEIPTQSDRLEKTVNELLHNPQQAQQYGLAGFQVLKQNQGSLQTLLHLLSPYLEK